MDWFDLLAVQGTLKSLLQHHSSKAPISSAFSFLASLAAFCCPVAQSRLTLSDPMDGSMPGIPVLHHLPKLAQIPVH